MMSVWLFRKRKHGSCTESESIYNENRAPSFLEKGTNEVNQSKLSQDPRTISHQSQ